MYARLRHVALVFLAVLMPSAVSAQQTNGAPDAGGPRMNQLVTGVRQADGETETSLRLQARRQSMGKPVALMVVGGAAIVLGALIGDDIGTLFMIGGAVALLIGLYQYLR